MRGRRSIEVKDELYPEERIVGWYHSHPGFGVFLSEHDLFIQENFFSSPGQVAWVYDPHTDEEGCFGWVAGEVHRLSCVAVMDRNGDGVERTPKQSGLDISEGDEEEEEAAGAASARRGKTAPAWVRWTGTALTHISALVVGFLVAYLLFPRILALMIDPATGEVVVRDGRVLLPYLDQKVPEYLQPPTQLPAPAAMPAIPPESAQPAPAPPASPGSHP